MVIPNYISFLDYPSNYYNKEFLLFSNHQEIFAWFIAVLTATALFMFCWFILKRHYIILSF